MAGSRNKSQKANAEPIADVTIMGNNNDLVPINRDPTPGQLLSMAIEKNVDMAQLEKLMDLKERWDKGESRKTFFKAIAKFQSQCPVIMKNKEANFEGKQGGKINYKYASLDAIITQIKEALSSNGLSYQWKISESDSSIKVTCIVTHESGHSETNEMSGKADTSGVKNEIQSRGSTVSYLQRYTLIGALGLGTAQDDVDGDKKDAAKPEYTKPKDVSDDIKKEVGDIDNLPDLEKHWTSHISLQKFGPYVQLIKNRGNELKK